MTGCGSATAYFVIISFHLLVSIGLLNLLLSQILSGTFKSLEIEKRAVNYY